MKTGKLIGVGVGPGDPELMTLKAVRVIEESEVIAVPKEEAERSVAYQIATGSCAHIDEKERVAIPMPMTKDKALLAQSHDQGAKVLRRYLEEGKQIAFLTLGDPTIYSTYLYLHKRIKEEGFETEIVSGIPSFCAVAARLDMGLVESHQALHVIPASYPMEEALQLAGTKVLMKAGKKLNTVKKKLAEQSMDVAMVENCGMPQEKVYRSAEEIPDKGSYYSLLIVKEKP